MGRGSPSQVAATGVPDWASGVCALDEAERPQTEPRTVSRINPRAKSLVTGCSYLESRAQSQYAIEPPRANRVGGGGVRSGMRFSTPAAFSTEPALDAAIAQGFVAWLRAANERGPIAVTQWLERRAIGSDFPFHAVFARIEAVLPLDPDRDIHVMAELCHDLTDRVGPFDAEMAELFCQPVLRSGVRENELNTVAEAAAVITGLARDFGEPQTIARLWLGLLNWTRVRSGETPVEFLETGFDQLSEAAAMDHQPGIA